MLTLDLNLSSRPFKNDTLPWVGVGLAVVVLTLLTIWNVRAYRQNSKWVEDLQQQYSTTREELAKFDSRERGAQKDIQGYDLEALHIRADKANEVILWKAFSWTRLFNLLQEVLPNDVQMISIRPIFRPLGADKGRDDDLGGRVPVSVEGVAKSFHAFLAFERALLAHENFARVEPEGHTESRTGSLAFQLNFLYDYDPGSEAEPEPEPEVVAAAVADEPAVEPEPSAVERPSRVAQDDSSAAPPGDEVDPDPESEPEAQTAADAGAAETTPTLDNEVTPKRPKPPSTRRRGKRPRNVEEKEGDQ